jgi:hypothetical protein
VTAVHAVNGKGNSHLFIFLKDLCRY